MKQRQSFVINSFSGLNQGSLTRGTPGAFIDGQNFLVSDDGYLRKSFGTRKTFEGHGLDGIFSLFVNDEEALRVFAAGLDSGGDVKLKMNAGGSWQEVTLASTMAALSESSMWWISYKQDAYFFNKVISGYYDSSVGSVVDLDEENKAWFLSEGGVESNYIPIRGFSPVIHFNALWLAGVGEMRNAVLFSQNFKNIFYDIYTGNLPALNFVSVGGDDSSSGATEDEITGIAEWGSDLFVGKNRSIHRIVGTGSDQYKAIPINADVGVGYGGSMQHTRAGIIWLEDRENGFWLYNGQLQNISKAKIDGFVGEIDSDGFISSGVFRGRYYYLSINASTTLVYDTEMQSWSKEDVSYGGFARYGVNRKKFVAAHNEYSTAVTQVIDPARPADYQDILKKEYVGCDIVEFLTDSGARKLEDDGSGGEELSFSAQTPFFFMEAPTSMKTFYECIVMYSSAQPELLVDLDIDGKRFYRDLKINVDPRPRFDLSHYGVDSFENIPFYTGKLLLPWEATGYSMSLIFKESSKFNLKIHNIIIYYLVKGRYSEEKE